jgi:hypothetical protein
MSTSRRIASESVGLSGSSLAHLSTAFRAASDKRMPTIGLTPVAGRPRLFFFCLADILDRIFVFLSAISLRQCRPSRRRIAEPPLRLGARVHGRQPVAFG